MSCRTGCPTQDHASWGACARDAQLQIGDLTGAGQRVTTDRRLGAYQKARQMGLQPPTTQLRDSLGMIEAVGG